MTITTRLAFTLTFGLFSCLAGEDSTAVHTARAVHPSHQIHTDTAGSVTDTIRKFIVDDYPVTNQMLDDTTGTNSSYAKQSGAVLSLDKVWFTNDALGQTLVFEMYTDKHRLITFHFYSDAVPTAIIEQMELHNRDGELAGLDQKRQAFKDFVNTASKIAGKYFISNKGFKLGDHKDRALRVYGTPDSRTVSEGFEILEWSFVGDAIYDGKTALRSKPLARDSYGHQVTMFFKKDKLFAIVLHNDIP